MITEFTSLASLGAVSRPVSRPTFSISLALLALALFCAACNSTDVPSASDNGGAGGTGGTGGTTKPLDTWQPPEPVESACSIAADTTDPTKTEFLTTIGCRSDFDALASVPLNTAIPGASSGKIVLDQDNGDALYFQNSKLYDIHYEFASTHLSALNGYANVGALYEFNSTQYSASSRRFLLGAVTYYSGPNFWALEMAPYDTATAPMIEKLFRAVQKNAYFGPSLVFHPTSDTVEAAAASLPADIHVKTTDQIFAGIDYQPLNLGECVGKLHFVKTADLATDFVGFRDIVVLDAIPNDISVTAGIITQASQTPLSHVNVLATNRGTPNMGLRNATTNTELTSRQDQWVRLTVGPEDWKIATVTQAEADAWWEAHKPAAITLPPINLSITEFRDIEQVTVEDSATSLRESIRTATLAYGAKAANYSVLSNTEGVPVRKAFAIPIYYYAQFMQENGFYDQVRAMIADPEFQNSLSVRSTQLAALRTAITKAPVNQGFQDLLKAKLAEYPGLTMRFRTSTNAEDLDGFPCAGCYDSHTGDPANWTSVLDAIRVTWSGVWFYRTFQEREYHSIDHTTVGMALLVHHNFPDEEANGVAITGNIFVPSGLDPAFYVNVQEGDSEVVAPPAGVTTDEFLYYFNQPNQPITMISHSNIVKPAGASVLTLRETYNLGVALDKIHTRFSTAYGPGAANYGWYAMDVEFKFDDEDNPGGAPTLIVKQARPYPGQQQ
jgi:hypothetical protein